MRKLYREWGRKVKPAALLVLCALLVGSGDLEEQLERSRQLEEQLDRLTGLYRAGAIEEVLRAFDQELVEADLTPRLWNLRGLALNAVGRPREGVAAFETGIRIDPSRAELHQNLAITLLGLGATGRAMAEFEQALELDPLALEARLGLGNELVRLGRTAAARSHLEVAAERAPRDPRVLRAMALLADRDADADASLRWWSRLERVQPQADGARRLGQLYGASNPDSAIAAFDRCAARDTSIQDCALAAAALLLNAGDSEGARRRLEVVARRAPLDAAGEVNLLLALQRTGAIEALERRVSDTDPLTGSAWGIVALARRDQGEPQAALTAARRSVELAPDDATLNNLLAVLLAEAGKVAEARAIWQRILVSEPEHLEAKANLAAYGRN